jgi:hypothetical protein
MTALIYKFSYDDLNFEIEVKKEKTIVYNEEEKTERYVDMFSFSCDKKLYYSPVTKLQWRATAVELKNKLQSLYSLVKKHYAQLCKNTDLTWEGFVELLPAEFKENYLERFW